jgi:hypothetical protein
MTVELLVRGRFVPLPGATVERVAGNAFTVRIPDPDALRRRTRRGANPEDWDGAVFSLDEVETEPGLGSGLDRGAVLVSVWIV